MPATTYPKIDASRVNKSISLRLALESVNNDKTSHMMPLVGLSMHAVAASTIDNFKLEIQVNCMFVSCSDNRHYTHLYASADLLAEPWGSRTQLHGQNARACAVRIVSNPLTRERVDTYHCQGLSRYRNIYISSSNISMELNKNANN